jgi:hypothetical protein
VHEEIAAFASRTGADELMIVSHIFDHAARLRSFEIVAQLLAPAVTATEDIATDDTSGA